MVKKAQIMDISMLSNAVNLTVKFTVDGSVWQSVFTIDLSQFAGKTDTEVNSQVLSMLASHIAKCMASQTEIDGQSGLWRRAAQYMGQEFTFA